MQQICVFRFSKEGVLDVLLDQFRDCTQYPQFQKYIKQLLMDLLYSAVTEYNIDTLSAREGELYVKGKNK